jgi:xylulokinase
MDKALGIDISTQSVTAIVLDPFLGELCCREQIYFGSDFPERGHPEGFINDDRYELECDEMHADPLLWLDAIEMVLDRLSKSMDLSHIQAVAVSGQQHGSVYLTEGFVDAISDMNMSLDTPMSQKMAPFLSRRTSPIWMDNSTSQECREIASALGGDLNLCRITGSVATCRFTGPQIRKFSKRNPEKWTLTHRIHLVSSFVTSVLAGVDSPIDIGDAAGMNLMDINTSDWSQEVLNVTADGLCSKLPQICSHSISVIGSISYYFSGRYGFSKSCKVVVGTGDNPSSLVGVGGAQSGTHVLSLGTSDTLFSAMDSVCTDPEGFGHVFGNPLGGFMSLLCFRNGALARDIVRKEAACGDWTEFSAAIESSLPALNVFLPFEVDEITPKRQKGRIYAYSIPHNLALPRASIEGQILNIKIHSRWINCVAKKIILTGGASQSDSIAQIVSDIFGLPVYRIAVSDSAALGAAMRAAYSGLGVSIETLVDKFCTPVSGVIMPNLSFTSAYSSLEDKLKRALLEPGNKL